MCLSVLVSVRAQFVLTPGFVIQVKNPNVLTGIESKQGQTCDVCENQEKAGFKEKRSMQCLPHGLLVIRVSLISS